MTQQPGGNPQKPLLKRRGVGLIVTGILVMILFGIYIIVGKSPGEGLATPVWLGVALGLIMTGFGVYRALAGPGALDNPEGGTNNEPM